MHSTLGNVLRSISHPSQEDWDEMVPYAVYAINTSAPRTTKITPFFLMHGREAVGILDIVTKQEEKQFEKLNTCEWFTALHKARQLAAQRDGEARGVKSEESNFKGAVKTPSDSPRFEEGDLVLVKFTKTRLGKSTKLLPKQQGPYRIIKIEDGTTAVLENIHNSRDQRKRHLSLVVPFKGKVEEVVGDDEWDVQEIMDEKEEQGEKFYLCRFRGYSKDQDEWIPASRVNAPILKEKWEKNKVSNRVQVARVFQMRKVGEQEEFLIAEDEDIGPEGYIWLTREKVQNPEVLDTFVTGGDVELVEHHNRANTSE